MFNSLAATAEPAGSSTEGTGLGRLCAQHDGVLRRFIARRAGQLIRAKESISDLVQSVYREALHDASAMQGASGKDAFRNWLFLIAERKLASRGRAYRAAKRCAPAPHAAEPDLSIVDERDAGHTQGGPETALVEHEVKALIRAALATLPAEWRTVVELARFDGLSHAEIGRRIGKSEGATRVVLSRALAKIAPLLEPLRDHQRR